MRVKTVPRHRIPQNTSNIEIASRNFAENLDSSKENDPKNEVKKETLKYEIDGIKVEDFVKFEQSEDSSTSDEEETDSLHYTDEALDMSNKSKVEPQQRNVLDRCLTPASSSSTYSETSLKEDMSLPIHNDDNNNALPSNAAGIKCCSMAGPPSGKYPKLTSEMNASSNSDDDTLKAVNLSKKDCQEHVEDDSPKTKMSADDKLKDTFLYKIMTDPTFLESIQKNKHPKEPFCQFCKQEFASGDELADHMDVKKDESNQMVCCACKKTFAQKRYLRYHQRCHSERTKFTCDICTKKYTRLDNLTRHNAFHVNPDKFSCTSCEKTFARKDLLNKHLKCHDNKHRFFCASCQRYFKGALTLDNHNKVFHSVT